MMLVVEYAHGDMQISFTLRLVGRLQAERMASVIKYAAGPGPGCVVIKLREQASFIDQLRRISCVHVRTTCACVPVYFVLCICPRKRPTERLAHTAHADW